MAYKKKTMRKPMYKRKRYTKRRYNNKLTNRSYTTQPIATRALVQMKYTETILPFLALSAAAPNFYFFRLNSIFDPNLTGVGHQPYGHDTYATLYNRYRVYKVKWSLTLPSDPSLKYQVAIGAVNHQGTASNLDAIAEQPGTIVKWISPGSETMTISGVAHLPKVHGNTSAEYKGDDRCSSNFGDNPLEVMTLRTCFYAPNTMNIAPTWTFIYYTELFDPIDLASS